MTTPTQTGSHWRPSLLQRTVCPFREVVYDETVGLNQIDCCLLRELLVDEVKVKQGGDDNPSTKWSVLESVIKYAAGEEMELNTSMNSDIVKRTMS